jgi:hypothetical protein
MSVISFFLRRKACDKECTIVNARFHELRWLKLIVQEASLGLSKMRTGMKEMRLI